MSAGRICSEPGCPVVVPAPGRCQPHARQRDLARGSRQARGYDRAHDRERTRWARRLARGPVACARCSGLVTAADDWHLDHTDDRATWLGPSHARCNLRAAGLAAHR